MGRLQKVGQGIVRITIQNGNMCELDGDRKTLVKLFQAFCIKHPNAWHIQMYQRGNNRWDGTIKYISETGRFRIGLFPMVYNMLKEWNVPVQIRDHRLPLEVSPKIPDYLGNLKLYDRQKTALKKLLFNKVGGIYFRICAGDLAVGFGKCIGGDSLINTSEGIMKISQMFDSKGNLKQGYAIQGPDLDYHPVSRGIKENMKALRITTSQGYTQVCGYDRHRYYTITPEGKLDWVLARELKEGDYIPLMKTPVRGSNQMDLEEAYVWGCLQGDGHLSRVSPTRVSVSISGKDYEVAYAVQRVLSRICQKEVMIKPHGKFEGFHISISNKKLSKYILEYLPELAQNAESKIIPDFIMNALDSVKRAYIAGLWDTDGSKHKDNSEYSFSSICKENIHRLQYLLLNLGIASFVSEKKTLCMGKRGITYRMRISSREMVNFGTQIPLRIPRKQLTEADISHVRNRLYYQLPLSIGEKARDWYRAQPYTTRDNPLSRLCRSQLNNPHRFTRESLTELLSVAPQEELQEILEFSNQVYWDTIKSIEVIEDYTCYDIEVPDIHCYLADGFICHNTVLFTAIHEAFQRKLRTILLLNDADLFNQFKREIPPMLPGEDIKFIQGSKVDKWGMFNVAMVQSLSRNLKKYQHELSNIDIVLIDEADIIDNKTYKGVIEHLYNTQVRIGLSGTIYMSKLKKDVMHNMNIRSFIGDKVDEVKLADQMKSGRATPVIVKMVDCNIPELNKHLPKFPARDYLEEYQNVIANNQAAYAISFSRMLWNLKYKRLPMIIMTKFIEHCENLYTYYQSMNKKLGLGLRIAYAHHETKKRESILQEMREGKLDILIITTIIARGKNIPTLQYLQNTAGMDSNEKTVQVLGRLVRKHESKNKAYLDDLCFPGHYLSRHNKHRKVYYQRERLKVIQISFDSKGKKRVVKRSKYAKNKRVKRIKNQ